MAARPLSWLPDLSSKSGPVYIALTDQLARDIASGKLAEGTRLPPQRSLAWALGVTHGTVTRAYERAERHGLVRGEVGRGTFVAPKTTPPSPLLPPADGSAELDLARNFSLPHLDPDLSDALSQLSKQNDLNALLSYVPSEGLFRHREAGAAFFRYFNIHCDADSVLVTSGAQHGLQILLQGLFKDEDNIAVDALNYPNLISAAPRLGVKLLPVPCDSEGMDAEALDSLCQRKALAGMICMPNVQNPTGRQTSPKRMQELAACARHHDLHVIEDDPYSPLMTDAKHSFHALIPERVSVIATTSKVVGGGLRLGYVTTPSHCRAALARAVGDTSWMASPLSAEIARYWIMSGTIDQVLERKRDCLKVRHQLVRSYFGKQAELYPDRLSCWLHLPEGKDPAILEVEAMRSGVAILGGHHFVVGQGEVPPAVRLTMGSVIDDRKFKAALSLVASFIAQA